MVCSKNERLVDVFFRGYSFFEEFNALVQKRHQSFIDDESRLVERFYDRLPKRVDKTSCGLDGRFRSLTALDQLDEFHRWYWVEKVESQYSVRSMSSTG